MLILRTHRSASLVEPMGSTFSKRPCFKTQNGDTGDMIQHMAAHNVVIPATGGLSPHI